ncbi:Sec-independent protein translocase TatA [Roseovarius sp. A46]|jgi:sec-independent protein translocase protein TatA|uniref:twin-arginine translocase TatA/TatE family subunit n=1 Tax=Roseovarius sp. A46 TaxID=2109331 RepID=UPI000E994308|nr:twin-arginine translocase TatA/TatE family subunit [Roseovarius sp. A46]RXV66777.1 Sec-independent protein translocase TatA [Roseovarius sp. A46]HAW47840.1 Sec-independent protein translocase TatA [Roseovarius sp.]|tara:strand:- start:698 stop:928 length:231 start_codon:yes stop_codon:yes gene_type:complete
MLNNIGLPGLLLIAVVVLVLFGRGKISSLMGEVGKGITSFKKGVSEGTKELEDETESTETARDVTPADKGKEKDKV